MRIAFLAERDKELVEALAEAADEVCEWLEIDGPDSPSIGSPLYLAIKKLNHALFQIKKPVDNRATTCHNQTPHPTSKLGLPD